MLLADDIKLGKADNTIKTSRIAYGEYINIYKSLEIRDKPNRAGRRKKNRGSIPGRGDILRLTASRHPFIYKSKDGLSYGANWPQLDATHLHLM